MPTPKPLKPHKESTLERRFRELWESANPDLLLTPEYVFAPPRRWRADFAHPTKVLIEIEGAIFQRGGGRHNRGVGMAADADKYNAAAALGYAVFRLTDVQLRGANVDGVIDLIAQTIRKRLETM